MTIPINVQIDELYNPSSIRDRALQTYEIIRKRNKLLTDYDGKLDKIKSDFVLLFSSPFIYFMRTHWIFINEWFRESC